MLDKYASVKAPADATRPNSTMWSTVEPQHQRYQENLAQNIRTIGEIHESRIEDEKKQAFMQYLFDLAEQHAYLDDFLDHVQDIATKSWNEYVESVNDGDEDRQTDAFIKGE